jgi:hypothetical protein
MARAARAKAPKKRSGALKVFRTAIGFHDAYVAAPSQKAALAAWGSDADLFARGMAERVTDEKLAAEPLANPGTVIKRVRGTAAEHLAALPKSEAKQPRPPATAKTAPSRPPRKPKPRPSRAKLDEAEQLLDELEARHAHEVKAIAAEEAALARRRRTLEATHEKERDQIDRKVSRARESYDAAMTRWRG